MPKRLTPEEKQRREEEKRIRAEERERKRQEREEQKKLKEQEAERRRQEAEKKRKEREEQKRLKEKEKQDWEALYYYVKDNIMGYDQGQALSQKMCLRLKGLLTNKFMENHNTKDTASYSYEMILNTFKFCSSDIKKAFRTNRFSDEMHRFNYALKIVEGNINDIYIRMRNAERAREEAKNMTIEVIDHIGAEFKPRKKKKDRFSDLW